MILTMILFLFLNGMSITAGYHRYYSHRSYKAHPLVEGVLLFFATMACQGSVLRWACDHRLHHAHVDTDEDPYSIKKGFWFAHFMWLMEKPKPIDPKVVSDLMKNSWLRFQDRYYPLLMVFTNVLAILGIGWLLNDYLGSLVIAFGVRLFLSHHFTWFINSLAHTWGDRPFCQEQSAVNNYIIALVTFGEGYHNYHHVFANDYRNGVRWFHFDPTKWLIWTLNKVGLTGGLKRVDSFMIKKRIVLERKELLLDQIRRFWHEKKEELEKQINELSTSIIDKITTFNQLKEKYTQFKRECAETTLLNQVQQELKNLKKSIREEYRRWKELSNSILSHKILPQPS
jgi:stearoyl-CoA desaturase (delta-9 desaturase)